MANREELGIIRGARTGNTSCQLALGKLYLFGSAGLPRNIPSALHWLQRAAQQDCADAWLLIGAHIPFDVALQSMAPVIPWYERAHDAGVAQAGLVLAQLVLAQDVAGSAGLRAKALAALEGAALAGLPDAQWLLAQQGVARQSTCDMPAHGGQEWLTRAADSGVAEALYAVVGKAWDDGDLDRFLQRALPMARMLHFEYADGGKTPANAQLAPQEVLLLSRCAQALTNPDVAHEVDQTEIAQFCELAAQGGDRAAQLVLGLWFGRMDAQGTRIRANAGPANFKRAIRWLIQAGEQGLAEAWFALSRIYLKPEFSQRSVTEAQSYLERAADMGHGAAQFECGIHAWRTRRDSENNDVRAAYWLLKAAAQGCPAADNALRKIVTCAQPAQWMHSIGPLARLELASSQPFLAARLELASLFHLSRAEALLLDINAADQGHCLVVDIRAAYGRSKRRIVVLHTAKERHALDRITRLFDDVDCSLKGPEGNYRQRLYRLKTCLPDMASGAAGRSIPDDLATAD